MAAVHVHVPCPQLVLLAYDVLGDHQLRQRYDTQGLASLGPKFAGLRAFFSGVCVGGWGGVGRGRGLQVAQPPSGCPQPVVAVAHGGPRRPLPPPVSDLCPSLLTPPSLRRLLANRAGAAAAAGGARA